MAKQAVKDTEDEITALEKVLDCALCVVRARMLMRQQPGVVPPPTRLPQSHVHNMRMFYGCLRGLAFLFLVHTGALPLRALLVGQCGRAEGAHEAAGGDPGVR